MGFHVPATRGIESSISKLANLSSHFCKVSATLLWKVPFFFGVSSENSPLDQCCWSVFYPGKMLRRRQNQRKIMRRKRKPLRCGATTTLRALPGWYPRKKPIFFQRWEIFHVTSHFFPQISEAFNRMNVLQIGSLVGPLHALKSLWKC